MTIHRGYLTAFGALLLASCVAETVDDKGHGASGGATAAGGKTGAGGKAAGSGGKATGSGGKAAGSGGTASGGASGDDAGPEGSPEGAAPDAKPDGARVDAKPDGARVDARADAAVCSPSADPCDACVQTKCCPEYAACEDVACAGEVSPDGAVTDVGEYLRFAACMQEAFATDGGTASVDGCLDVAKDAGTVAATTRALVDCVVGTAPDAGRQQCSLECFGGEAVQ